MSSVSESDSQFIEQLTILTLQLNRYLSVFIFIFGILGNFLNILVLSQRTLKRNSCAWLFLISSIANLISILFGLTPRIFLGWYIDLTETNPFYCKLRAFMMFTSRTIAFWLILFATIDRWILSLPHAIYRHIATLKTAKFSCTCLIIFCSLLYSHILFCYEPNQLYTPLKCYGKTNSCRLLTDITYASFTICLPAILMIVFGLYTISNVHQQYKSISPGTSLRIEYNQTFQTVFINEEKKRRWKKLDRYLRRMLLLQITLLTLLTLPQTIHKFYSTITYDNAKTPVQQIIDRALYNFDLLLPYIASGMPFYIYTLAGGRIFRKALRNIFCR